jgi:hypothetical protein
MVHRCEWRIFEDAAAVTKDLQLDCYVGLLGASGEEYLVDNFFIFAHTTFVSSISLWVTILN